MEAPSYLDRRYSKQVRDNVHGHIYLDPRSSADIFDTNCRLRDLKQLGLTYMVYPGAVHSRFEHSLGVYWLAGDAVYRLKAQQGSELGIEGFDIQTVKLAGLLHDVGHGPFSHMFEHEFLPRALKNPGDSNWSHEDMSLKLIDYIVDAHHIDIGAECIQKAKSTKEKGFLFDIVANGRNGIDVDKFDYIVRDTRACGLCSNFQFERLLDNMRVIDGQICYPLKDYLTVNKLFTTRADLHRTVYLHAKVKAIELMVVDALLKADEFLQISSKIQDASQFWKIDDTILKTIEISDEQELKEARDLINRIRTRNLYQFCGEFSVPQDKQDHFKKITPQDIVCSQASSDVTLEEEDVIVSTIKIDLTRGMDYPLESVGFYENFEQKQVSKAKKEHFSHMLPSFCQDKIVRVYSRKPELGQAVNQAFQNYQEKTYGEIRSVLGTPRKLAFN
ncbi:hypothetical protein Tsubulata_046193 [Turnera subulata]|uniref:HD domain-containing protein n=1 Tax=Turnera subulata TaxID=218843 RepID=A0A9Q0JED8_9ROSI|nr:hypothetical protein Tsubulata_046193 [Turnera subulata]